MTTSTAVSSPSLAKNPKLNWPSREKSGPAKGSAGNVATSPGTRNATTVATTMPTRMPARTLAPSARRSPATRSWPRRSARCSAARVPESHPTVPVCPGTKVMTPAFRSPMKRMKNPIPTEMARLSVSGTMSITYLRTPSSTSTVMRIPSATTTPIASAGVRPIAPTRLKATIAFSPKSGRQGEGPVGVEPHHDGEQPRPPGRSRSPPRAIEPGRGEDRRVDGDDVGHHHEGGDPGQHLGPHRRAVLRSLKKPSSPPALPMFLYRVKLRAVPWRPSSALMLAGLLPDGNNCF